MVSPRVIAIIVNWKRKKETVESVHSLIGQSYLCSITVVDNGSQDESVTYIKQHCPDVEVIALPDNIGFGPACNQALNKNLSNNQYDYVFLFNNDATAHPDALCELIKVAQIHPQAAIFGAKVYYRDRPNVIWYAGSRRRQGVLAATEIGQGQIDQGQFDTIREVDYVFGAAMLIRCDLFKEIGLFDERFFMYLEDLDFCLRAQKAGYSLLFVPEAHVWHIGSASTADNLALRRYHMAKSTIQFLKKHTSLITSLPIFAFWVLVYLRDILGDLVQGDVSIVKAYWAGLINGLSET